MPTRTDLTCRCGKVHIAVEAEPILSVECQCNSCRKASGFLARLPGASAVAEASGGTAYVLCRKDRVIFTAGTDQFLGYRLTASSPTRRVVAACCNTPLFTEFQNGHWLSMYAALWPASSRPLPTMRTMVGDMPAGQVPPGDVPNYKTQSFGFFVKLLAAWLAMGFRTPAIAVPRELVVDAA